MNQLMKAVLAALVLAGCNLPPAATAPDFTSAAGVGFWLGPDSNWKPEQIQEEEDWFVAGLAGTDYSGSKILKALARARVYVTQDPIPCQSGLCNGIENENLLEVRNMACVHGSALNHEEAHWLQLQVHGFTDYNHTETALWQVADSHPRPCP